MFQTLYSDFDLFQIIHHQHTCEDMFSVKIPVCEDLHR